MYLYNTKKLNSIIVLFYVFHFAYGQNRQDSIQHLKEIVVTVKSYQDVILAQKLTGEDINALKPIYKDE